MTDQRSNSTLYGKGVFTTIAVRGGLPLLWEKHWARLGHGAERLGIHIATIIEDRVLADLTAATTNAQIEAGRARITITDKTSAALWTSEGPEHCADVNIVVGRQREIPRPLRLTTSPHLVNSTSPLAGVKSCNYLDPLLSHKEAIERGYHEAVRLNERGHVTSACLANIFWVRRKELFTPSLATGCLSGTTREFVLENIECIEVEAEPEALQSADALYLTSAGVGIIAVDEFGGRRSTLTDHPILHLWPPG